MKQEGQTWESFLFGLERGGGGSLGKCGVGWGSSSLETQREERMSYVFGVDESPPAGYQSRAGPPQSG